MNELQTTLEALRIFHAGRCVPALVWERQNRHLGRVPLRSERRHVGQLFTYH